MLYLLALITVHMSGSSSMESNLEPFLFLAAMLGKVRQGVFSMLRSATTWLGTTESSTLDL